jgi:hydroxyacylglutathione hydrolase
MSNSRNYLETKSVADSIWSIDGPANDLMYLVIGSERALLVDTGMGIGNLAGVVKSLTDLPLTVVNTHGHPDHAGGNSNFGQVWLPPKDYYIMREMCADEYRLNDLKTFLGESNPEYKHLVDGMISFKPYNIQPIKPGHVFDLGNRQFEVLETPGHTPGSVCLLDAKGKIMFTGDSIVATPVWMYLKHSVPVKTYCEGLKKLKEREDEFETLFPGHQPVPVGKSMLDDLIACAGEILDGSGVGERTQTFVGEGLLWTHGQGQIIYNPQNLR